MDEAKQVHRGGPSPWKHFSATDDDKVSNEIRERETSELVEQLQNVQMELVRVREQSSIQVEQLQKQMELKNTTLQALVSFLLYHHTLSNITLCRSHN